MMRRGSFIIGALLNAMASPCVASPEIAATVRVSLASPSALSVPASVEVTSLDGPPMTWSGSLREAAAPVLFRQLPPGPYRVVVRVAGFHDASADVRLRAATVNELEVDLASADVSGSNSTLRLLRSEPVSYGTAFEQPLLESLPDGLSFWSPIETAAGSIIVDRIGNGGLWLGEAPLAAGFGSSWRQTSIVIGSLDVTDPVRTGTPLVRSPQDTGDLLVSSVSLPASMSGPGPVISLWPRPPTSTWRGSAWFGATPDALQSSNERSGAPSIARFSSHRDGGVRAGGPLVRDRATLFASTRLASTDRIERDATVSERTSIASLLASSVVATGTTSQLQIVATADWASIPYEGRARFRTRDVRERDTYTTVHATWRDWTSGGTGRSFSGGYARGVLDPALAFAMSSDLAGAAGTVERLRDGPVATLFDVFPGTRQRWTARFDVSPSFAALASRHAFTMGAMIARNLASTTSVASPPAAELVNGLPARVWDYGYIGPESSWASTELAGYVADRIIVRDNVSIDAGARLEFARGAAAGASNTISWTSLIPRFNVRWAPGTGGRAAIFTGYSQYAHRLPLDYFAFGDPTAAGGRVSRWNDANGDGLFQEAERGVLIAAVGPCCAGQVDRDLRRPRTDEFVIGIELRLWGWAGRFAGFDRRDRRLIASVNTGVSSSDYTTVLIPDPAEDFVGPGDDRLLPVFNRNPSSFGGDQYLLTNPDGHDAVYQGIEVGIERAFGSRWYVRFEGTAFLAEGMGANRGFLPVENDQGLIGELFENPNATTFARGRLFFDRAYVMKTFTTYVSPGDYVLSLVARYQDGQPFARLAVVPDLNQGPEAVQAYARGRTRFTFTLTVDARAEKSWSLGRASVAAVLEAFNLLNTSNEVEEDVVTGPAFRTPTAVQPPRAARVGIRVGF